ncbi:MAG: GDSL-type esterase/lipase family protein, partial [Actinomycetota bacterium]|nr:GDSL-type esterase/lipase family protein [Actinomycetota bacterium]
AADTRLMSLRRAGAAVCSSAPLLRMASKPGRIARRALPACGSRLKWTVGSRPEQGRAWVKGNRFIFRQADAQSGADEFELVGRRPGGGQVVARRTVQLRVGPAAASSVSIRAIGDSVTAGFGYYGKTGRPMPITSLPGCKPGATVYNDACSSNSGNTSNKGSDPGYLSDFGLSRNISWAAQWANEFGITDYGNYAISGSAPVDWLPGGQFDQTRQQIEAVNPDYIVMTMGANPLLSDMLFGVGEMGCAVEADLFGDYRECIESAFASVSLGPRLNALYRQLVDNTTSRIVVMQYHLSIPSSALAYSAAQIELMGQLLNEVIASEANAVSPKRITVVAPPRFDVGIDMSPLYPARYSCSWFGWKVDGPSVQATPSQDFLEVLHPLSFCPGPADGPPWVISGDTGIHPSAAGYRQMASQIPPPG